MLRSVLDSHSPRFIMIATYLLFTPADFELSNTQPWGHADVAKSYMTPI